MADRHLVGIENCAAVVLAAGNSRRFGTADKLLADLNGRHVLAHVLERVRCAGVGQLLLVYDGTNGKVETLARSQGFEIIVNPEVGSGMGRSIARGIGAVAPGIAAAFIVLGDMPRIPPDMFGRLAARLGGGSTMARPHTPAGPGHPVLFMRKHFGDLQRLKGDTGAGALIAAHAPEMAIVATEEPGCWLDVDTPQALARICR